MSFAASIHALTETAAPERVGDRASTRLADVQGIVARELAEVEALIAACVAHGVAPATEAALHLAGAGGKRVRPTALLLAHACFAPQLEGGPMSAGEAGGAVPRALAAASELVHMATLLHDDVIDDGDQRRGRPTSRRVWGNAVSVLAGDLLLVEALRLARDASQATWSELVDTLGRLVDGEVVQLRGRLAVSLDEATYFAIVNGKTASLFEWALRAGAREGGAPASAIEALGAFGAHIGVAFQLVDDVLDYDADEAATGKAMLADLAEGKVTLPLIDAASLAPPAGQEPMSALVERVRRGEEGASAAASEIAARVRSSGACGRVRERAREETSRALAALEEIPACWARDVLADVARGLAARVS